MISLVVFDLAGTTVNDNRDVHRVLQGALKKFEVSITLDDANAVMGIPKPIAIRKLLEQRYKGNRAITEMWIDEIHKVFVADMIDFYSHDGSVSEKEGVSDLFQALKERKQKVVVDTGFDRKITNALLDRMGWQRKQIIDGSVTSDEVGRGRPYPDLIFEAMKMTNVTEPAQVAKVGDTVSDLEEGTSAGCGLVIGVTNGAFTADELRKVPHTHLVNDVRDVLAIVQEHSSV